jgi:hypothetical protein
MLSLNDTAGNIVETENIDQYPAAKNISSLSATIKIRHPQEDIRMETTV